MKVSSVCVYCGCGCRLVYCIKNNKVIKVLPDKSDEVSEGKPCIKGLTLNEVIRKGRISFPMIRRGKKLKKASWEKAYKLIYKKTKDLLPEDIFFVASGKITNEDNYIIQKFARIVFKTNNIDSCCSRLCHVATVEGLKNCLGISGNPWTMNDIYTTDCVMIIGSNPASNYPVFFQKILKAKKRGTRIISVQNMRNLTSDYADISLIIYPGTETALLNGIIKYLIEKKAYDKKAEKIDGFNLLKRVVNEYEEKLVCEICSIKRNEFQDICEEIEKSKAFGAIHGMGLTQHINAIENFHSLMNLILLKNGKLLSNRGEINVQGVGDMGCSPYALPAGTLMSFDRLKKIWGIKSFPKMKGKSITEAFLIYPVKAAFVSSFNPAHSLPNLKEVHKNLKKMFLIQMESYFNLTSKFAKVILPTPILIERNGTITTGERRIRFVKKVVDPFKNSKPEWIIFKELSSFFDAKKYFNYKSEKEIFEEIFEVIPAYRVDVDFLYEGNDGWADKEIKFKRFYPEKFEGIEDIRSEKYPFILTTFRLPHHFLTGELTLKSKTLKSIGKEAFCYINKKDAKKLKLKNGEKVKVVSSTSWIRIKIKIDERFPEGVVGIPYHFQKTLVNKLFSTQFDEETFTPNFKVVAVRIEKIKS